MVKRMRRAASWHGRFPQSKAGYHAYTPRCSQLSPAMMNGVTGIRAGSVPPQSAQDWQKRFPAAAPVAEDHPEQPPGCSHQTAVATPDREDPAARKYHDGVDARGMQGGKSWVCSFSVQFRSGKPRVMTICGGFRTLPRMMQAPVAEKRDAGTRTAERHLARHAGRPWAAHTRCHFSCALQGRVSSEHQRDVTRHHPCRRKRSFHPGSKETPAHIPMALWQHGPCHKATTLPHGQPKAFPERPIYPALL